RQRPAMAGRARPAQRAFERRPAVVLAAAAGGGLIVDLLARVLADIADEQAAGQAVEREAPRVAQPARPHLVRRVARAGERVRRRDAVVWRRSDVLVDIEAQQLAEQCVAALRVAAVPIARAAAVADADIQIAVGPERQ